MNTVIKYQTINRCRAFAQWLAIVIILYNLAKGLIVIFFGFGVDSFIEVMSGLGILAMVLRIQHNPDTYRSNFEKTALRSKGTSFYLLAPGLAVE